MTIYETLLHTAREDFVNDRPATIRDGILAAYRALPHHSGHASEAEDMADIWVHGLDLLEGALYLHAGRPGNADVEIPLMVDIGALDFDKLAITLTDMFDDAATQLRHVMAQRRPVTYLRLVV